MTKCCRRYWRGVQWQANRHEASPLEVDMSQLIIQLYNCRTPALDDKEEESGVSLLLLRSNSLPTNILWDILLMSSLIYQFNSPAT